MASRQQEKSEQTRMELKQSAAKLFLEKGYDRTTIAEITSNAGYATGSFYRHWKEKEELFNLIQKEFIEMIQQINEQAIKGVTSFEQMVDFLVNIILELTTNHATLRLFVESPQGTRNELFYKKMNDLLNNCTESLALKIQELSQGQKAEHSCHEMASLIYSFLSGYILFNSIEIEIPPVDTLKSALLAMLKME